MSDKEKLIMIINGATALNQSCATTVSYPIQLLLDEALIILGEQEC